jgi:hypothetical protein
VVFVRSPSELCESRRFCCRRRRRRRRLRERARRTNKSKDAPRVGEESLHAPSLLGLSQPSSRSARARANDSGTSANNADKLEPRCSFSARGHRGLLAESVDVHLISYPKHARIRRMSGGHSWRSIEKIRVNHSGNLGYCLGARVFAVFSTARCYSIFRTSRRMLPDFCPPPSERGASLSYRPAYPRSRISRNCLPSVYHGRGALRFLLAVQRRSTL